ncbi:MAG: aspartate aminotransferase family protein [Deltaproteobacteria bacterium]|nr:aspartate aminotransferase family protein [Deltaproteobacteria bacterium]
MSNVEELTKTYLKRTKTSARLAEEARKYMPGGDTHGHFYNPPYHITIERGEGCYLYDVDGNEYIDCVNAYFVLIHGHCFPPIVEALQKQITRGTGFGMPTEPQIAFARHLCERVPSLEEVRFVSSGSEATSMAIRAARAFTGRRKILKVEGGYHGTHNIGELNSFGGSLSRGELKPMPPIGADGSEIYDVILFPYNDADTLERIVAGKVDEIAALIVEPMIIPSGAIPPVPGYLEAVREITKKHDIVLIFDEVVTLPFYYGGLQEYYGVTPDMTTMGKGIGGGLPIGAWGGKREIMEMWNPERGEDAVIMVSTSGGNPLSMVAGLAAMKHLGRQEIERRNELGNRLRNGMNKVFRDLGIRGHVSGLANAFWIHWSDGPVRDPYAVGEAMANGSENIRNLLFLGMRYHGVYLFPSPSPFGNLSTQMETEHVDSIVSAFSQTLEELRPVIEKERPNLLCQGRSGLKKARRICESRERGIRWKRA